MRRRDVMVLLGAILGQSGCGSAVEWNRKITVEVTTPHGIVTGYSVQREFIAEKGGWWAPPEATGVARGLAGEAVVVDLGQGKYLFALIDPRYRPDTFVTLAPGEAPLEVAKRIESMRGKTQVPRKEYPLLVTFGDLNNPASVKEVRPENSEVTLGPGYKLRSVSLEITEEPVTKGQVAIVLVWIDQYHNMHFDGSRYHNVQDSSIKNLLSAGYFKTEKQ